MAPALSFDVLKRMGSPLGGSRSPLLPPPRQAERADGAPSSSPMDATSGAAASPRASIPHGRAAGDSALSAPAACGLPASPRGRTTPRARPSALDRETIEGVMGVRLKREKAKKKRTQLFPVAKASYFVVSDASKPVLEIYASEARDELVFLLSLAGAELGFEADNANIVMEKCFCVEVKTWKRKNTVYFKHQGFLFFEEDQARMLLWVKCIHSAIKKAAGADGELFRRTTSGPVSPASPFRDYERLESDGEEEGASDGSDEATAGAPSDSLAASYSSAPPALGENPPPGERAKLLQRLSIDPNYRVNAVEPTGRREAGGEDGEEKSGGETAARRMTTPSAIYKEPRTPLDRFNSMFSGQKQGLHRFQRNPVASRTGLPARELAKTLPASYTHPQASNLSTIGARVAAGLQPKLAESAAGWVPVVPPLSPSQRLADSSDASSSGCQRRKHRADGERAGEADNFPSSSSTRETSHYAQLSTMYAEMSHALSPTRLLSGLRRPRQVADEPQTPSQTPVAATGEVMDAGVTGPKAGPSDAAAARQQRLIDFNSSLALQRFIVLATANVAGAYRMSPFLPLAAVGLSAHVFARADQYAEWACVSAGVFLASYCHPLLGSGLIFICLFLWSYAEFQVRRRARRNAETRDDLPVTSRRGDSANITLPNWMVYPDVDRVDWLNDVFVTGWPYLKIAIRDSILNGLNPVLDAQRPPFISALSITRVELGDRPPQISGVKFVAAHALTDEATVDIALRVVTDDSFAAELKLVTSLGAAATMSLRDLFLVGTLRLTLNPLIGEWPCFSGLTLSFTSRPVFDFSLTAAKINLANVPFASEWLQSFLHDLLVSYFVWPKVLHIPLWEEEEPPQKQHDSP